LTEEEAATPSKKYESLEDIPGIGPATAAKLREMGFQTIESLATATLKDLLPAGIGEKQAAKIISEARNSIALTFVRADELLRMRSNILRLTTGSKTLDSLIGGGIETWTITEFYGEYGTGKSQLCHQLCLPYDEKLIIVRDGKYESKRIGELVRERPDGCLVIGFDPQIMAVKASKITQFFEHEAEEIIEITFEGNKKVNVTPEHPFFILNENLDVLSIEADRLKPGIFVATSLKIPAIGTNSCKDAKTLWLEGIYVAEGSVVRGGNSSHWVQFSNKGDIRRKLLEEYNARPMGESCISIYSADLARCFDSLGHTAFDKHFPEEASALPREQLQVLLDGYLHGDGVRGDFPATTVSPTLIDQLQLFALILGKPTWILNRGKGVPHRFAGRIIQSEHDAYNIYAFKRSPWILPAIIRFKLKELLLTLPRGKKRHHIFTMLSGCLRGKQNIHRKTLLKYLREIKQQTTSPLVEKFERICTSDVGWIKIKSIQRKVGRVSVYNIETECRNFLLSNGIFVHNCVNVQLPPERGGLSGGALYVDTENTFRPERISQMARHLGLDPEESMKNIIYAEAYTSEHQMLLLEKADKWIKENNIRLIIIDSLTAHFRSEYLGREMLAERQQKLNKHMHKLINLARAFNAVAIVTNQVMSKPDVFFGEAVSPVGGHIVAHTSHTRVFIRKTQSGPVRIARLVSSPYLPEGETVFKVTENGIEDITESDEVKRRPWR